MLTFHLLENLFSNNVGVRRTRYDVTAGDDTI